MSGDCPNCGTLQARLSQLLGGIAATLNLIYTETEEQPTMSRNQLVQVVKERLHDVLSSGY